MDEPKYKRVLLKISGEALAGEKHFGLDFQVLGQVADVIKECVNMGVQIGVVIGGGNAAVDVARAALRLTKGSVNMYCLEKDEEMPTVPDEKNAGIADGVVINNSWAPKAILGEGGKPVDCRIEDAKRTGEDFKKAKDALGDLAKSEEDVMSYICYPDQAMKFFEDRKAKEENVCTYVIEEA